MRERHIRARTRSTAQLRGLLSQVALEAASPAPGVLRASLRSQRVPSAICAVRKTLSPISKKRPETAPVSCHAQTQGTATGPPATTTPTKRFGALGVWPGGRGQVPVGAAMELYGTRLGGATHVVGFSSKGI